MFLHKMVSITLSIPEDVREMMRKFPEVNWSALVRKMIIEKANEMSTREELLGKLKEERDFIEWSVDLGRKAKKGRMKRILNDN